MTNNHSRSIVILQGRATSISASILVLPLLGHSLITTLRKNSVMRNEGFLLTHIYVKDWKQISQPWSSLQMIGASWKPWARTIQLSYTYIPNLQEMCTLLYLKPASLRPFFREQQIINRTLVFQLQDKHPTQLSSVMQKLPGICLCLCWETERISQDSDLQCPGSSLLTLAFHFSTVYSHIG